VGLRAKPKPASPNKVKTSVSRAAGKGAFGGTKMQDRRPSHLHRLMGLGFPERDVLMALHLCEDDLPEATQLLLESREEGAY